jgi:hypothetical protein
LWSTCPDCQTPFSFQLGQCGGDRAPTIVEVLPSDFLEFQRKLNPDVMSEVDALCVESDRKGYKLAWVGFKALEISGIGFWELREVGRRLGYKRGWAWHQYQKIANSA